MGSDSLKENRLAGQGAILLTALLWSTSGLFIKLLDMHPMLIALARSLVAAVFMLIVRSFGRKRGDGVKVKSQPFPFWGGATVYALTMVTFVIANKHTTSANAILLQYTAPIWAALLAWMLIREKPRWEHWGALLLVFAGLVIFFHDGLGSGALLGDSLALFSGLTFGATTVFLRMMKDGNPQDSLILAHVLCAAAGIPFIFIVPPSITTSSVLIILFMGVIQLGMASVLYSYGMRHTSAVQAMLTAIIEPVFNPVWVLLVTGERPTANALAGGAIIVAAVIASSLIGGRREKKEDPHTKNTEDTEGI